MSNPKEFRDELEALINRCSMESTSNTPDYILAGYLTDCLAAFDRATGRRETWFSNNKPRIGRLLSTPGAAPADD